ncbi:hypothetical protein AOXY_G15597 [Acipenser oxyrinchus oxyrinchus]|uniref:Uncharacterized protein n=1 Tax=Acipenser oxyrinchus oxyrinchus TaxID=40147 RepID=A0AAD8D9I8_ACIOX|nr:hypothetical protein AOXY_G15597 [Acipenser oxyrinchus oxyrinchus]
MFAAGRQPPKSQTAFLILFQSSNDVLFSVLRDLGHMQWQGHRPCLATTLIPSRECAIPQYVCISPIIYPVQESLFWRDLQMYSILL